MCQLDLQWNASARGWRDYGMVLGPHSANSFCFQLQSDGSVDLAEDDDREQFQIGSSSSSTAAKQQQLWSRGRTAKRARIERGLFDMTALLLPFWKFEVLVSLSI